MLDVRLQENWRKSPSWYPTEWSSIQSSGSRDHFSHKEREKEKDWGGRVTRGSPVDEGRTLAASSTDDRREQCKKQYKYLNVTSEDMWDLRTYKVNTEANSKVYDLNQKTMKSLDTLALLHANFEKVSKDMREVEAQFDRDLHDLAESMRKVSESREQCHDIAETHARIEADLNEVLGVIRVQVKNTAAATHASSRCTNDRDNNEVRYLQEGLTLLDSFLNKETHNDEFEEVVTEGQVP